MDRIQLRASVVCCGVCQAETVSGEFCPRCHWQLEPAENGAASSLRDADAAHQPLPRFGIFTSIAWLELRIHSVYDSGFRRFSLGRSSKRDP
jgi:hypothetical protein